MTANKNNFPNIHDLLYSVYDMAGISVRLFTANSIALSVLPPDSICDSFFHGSPHLIRQCHNSTARLFETAGAESAITACCPNGFNKIAFPVRIGGKIIYMIVVEGFLFDDEPERRVEMLMTAMGRSEVRNQILYGVWKRLHIVKRSDFNAAAGHCLSLIKGIENSFEPAAGEFDIHSTNDTYLLNALEDKLSGTLSAKNNSRGFTAPAVSETNEMKLFEALELYRTLFEHSSECAALADAYTGIISDCSRSFLDLLECHDKSELIGKPVKTLHPAGEQCVGYPWQFENEPGDWHNKNYADYRLVTKNGTIKEIKITVRLLEINGKKIVKIIFKSLTGEPEADTRRSERIASIEIADKCSFGGIVGKSDCMKAIFETLHSVSECDSNVLIEGPSGTGKSLIARTLHDLSARRTGPFIVVNCGALPDTLLESELFGYVRGAFTDAKKDKPGRFQMADKGTIFLDEIGELPFNLQVKLLRVIEEKSVEPLGSTKTVKIDFRLIAATNQNLKELVRAGKFREDLYYRLRVAYYNIPPFKERRGDILLIANNFIDELNTRHNKYIREFSDEVHAILKNYDFPGNARELYNMLEYAYILCKSSKITLNDLPREFTAFHEKINGNGTDESVPPRTVLTNDKDNDPADTICKFTKRNNDTNRKANMIGRERLIETLTKYKFNKSKTAKALNISRMTLWRLIKKIGLCD
ncbi:MAG TPA: hypothetical protein DC017_06885 [Candidatus Wallbacteria bacterium]|nr:hypothetical protein [Candidatus Wallbacteria bacterium]